MDSKSLEFDSHEISASYQMLIYDMVAPSSTSSLFVTCQILVLTFFFFFFTYVLWDLFLQVSGIRFMWENIIQSIGKARSGDTGLGCILAHTMGLGKTFQVVK